MRNFFFFILWLISTKVLWGQQSAGLNILPQWNKKSFLCETNYFIPHVQDSVRVDVFRCYFSNFRWLNEQGKTISSAKNVHLFDLSDTAMHTLHFEQPIPAGARFLEFNLGIDSLTQISGALGGDLDPGRGMYWAWQSGYIQLKLEGSSPVCQSRKNRFQYHLGGYLPPFQTIQTLRIPIHTAASNQLVLPMDKILALLPLTTLCEVMSPRAEAVLLSQQIAHCIQSANEK